MQANHAPGSYSLMRLMVTQDGEHTISVSQIDERCYSRHSDYDYSNVRMIVMRITQDSDKLEELEMVFEKSTAGWDRDTHIQIENLEKGEYYVFAELDWQEDIPEHDKNNDFCLTCYGKSKSFFLRDEKTLFDKVEFLKKVYKCQI